MFWYGQGTFTAIISGDVPWWLWHNEGCSGGCLTWRNKLEQLRWVSKSILYNTLHWLVGKILRLFSSERVNTKKDVRCVGGKLLSYLFGIGGYPEAFSHVMGL